MKMKNDLTHEKEEFISACLEWALKQEPTQQILEWVEWAMDRLGIPAARARGKREGGGL